MKKQHTLQEIEEKLLNLSIEERIRLIFLLVKLGSIDLEMFKDVVKYLNE